MKRILVPTLRALFVRCPNCGGGGLLRSWFHLKAHCPRCGLALERHEGEDYFLGGMMFNIVLSELVWAAGMLVWLMVTWPDVPWTLLEWVGIPAMAVMPILFYPISKTVWLAFDLMFRPATHDELAAGRSRQDTTGHPHDRDVPAHG